MFTLFFIFIALFVPVWGKSDLAQLSPAQQIIVGGVTGAATATAIQPLMFIKNRLQQGKALTEIRAEVAANPKVLYRGYPLFACSLTPVTAVQVMVAGQLTNLIGNRELEAKEKLAVSTVAGAASAAISNPSELTTLHQQNSGRSLWQTVHALTSQHGLRVVARGIGATACREGGFTAGYGAIYPLFKEWLMKVDNGSYKAVAPITAAVGAGIVTTIITHPFDAVKIPLQEDIARQQYRNMLHAAWKMYQARGVKAFASGIIARGIAVTFRVGATGNFKEKVTGVMVDHNTRRNQA